ncbi:MAG TPA: ABC transporter permease [Kaistella sp.]|jgi:ABC-type polysaccharide/polyol phosphate export systems, permease component|nr:ABC transporter permease [Flavobacteriales bacterium]MCA0391381.1 ABC transporter permease [Bacteroidota bacterium]HOB23330.1 ABC transporter permease [Kaistella sp.]MBN8622487.1 ABC transporter permease [Flavobacteriales bacterium]HPZ24575.1 ABC transporter permease [Kaistella sp.]
MTEPQQQWTETIESKHSLFDLKLGEVWRYKDLVYMFVKRDFVSSFKQTVLGPVWFFINPILTTIVYLVIFGNIAGLSTDGVPKVLFYLSGVTLWNYFASCLTGASNVFTSNAGIFGKVYFPRLVMPLTVVISNLMRFGVQFLLFLLVFFYYLFKGEIQPNIWILATPFLIILMAAFALGAGMIFSAMTTKYRDLQMLLTFGVSLYMYATPVVYPLSALSGFWRKLAYYNPLTGIFECFKYGWLGSGDFSPTILLVSSVLIFILLAIGTVIFNKVEKSFMDTV